MIAVTAQYKAYVFLMTPTINDSEYYRIERFRSDFEQNLVIWRYSLFFARSALLKRIDLAKSEEDICKDKSIAESDRSPSILRYKSIKTQLVYTLLFTCLYAVILVLVRILANYLQNNMNLKSRENRISYHKENKTKHELDNDRINYEISCTELSVNHA